MYDNLGMGNVCIDAYVGPKQARFMSPRAASRACIVVVVLAVIVVIVIVVVAIVVFAVGPSSSAFPSL